ncbi:MAG: tripartite tricarboxylate transporter substrate binding protein [Pseudomonadota bacterium]
MQSAKRLLTAAAALLCAATIVTPAQAQGYPAKSVRIIVPYGTGGGSDVLARQIGAGLQPLWGQGVVVENKAGASGNIGTQDVVRAQPDGYTLLLQNSTMVTNLGLTGKLPYDPEKDLTPIMLLGVTPIALAAHPGANVNNIRELAAAAKAKPDAFTYGSCGIGTPQHFVMELLKQESGVTATHAGYKGCAPALTDVVGGQIPLVIISANLVAPHAKTGALKALGVSTAQRYALLPNTPTFEEQGFKPFDFSIWYALMGPAKMPPDVVAKITADVTRVLADARVQENLSTAGVVPFKGSAADLASLIKSDAARYVKLAKSANIKAE